MGAPLSTGPAKGGIVTVGQQHPDVKSAQNSFADTKLLNKVIDIMFSVLSKRSADECEEEKEYQQQRKEISGVGNSTKGTTHSNRLERRAVMAIIIVLAILGSASVGLQFGTLPVSTVAPTINPPYAPTPAPTLANSTLRLGPTSALPPPLETTILFGTSFNISTTTDMNLFNLGLHGTVPTELGLLTPLTSLDLGWNLFYGSIPSELGMLTKLTHLDLGFNVLTGSIPAEMGEMKALKYLRLSHNFLDTETVPTELGSKESLEILMNDNNGIIRTAENYHGINWPPPGHNFADGWIVPSGLNSSDTPQNISFLSKHILSQLKSRVNENINTIRLAINPPTVLDGTWWPKYQLIIQEAAAQNLQVILGCWAANNIGKIENHTRFNEMWDTVVEAYQHHDLVSFEIFNSPHGYSNESEWRDVAAKWMKRYALESPLDGLINATEHGTRPKIRDRSRIFVSGFGRSENVTSIARDKRFDGCMLGLVLFPNQGMHKHVKSWQNELWNRVDKANANRTVVVAWGAPMDGDPKPLYDKFYNKSNADDHYLAYMLAMSKYLKELRMGTLYWPGLRDASAGAMVYRDPDYELHVVNPSGAKLFGDSMTVSSSR